MSNPISSLLQTGLTLKIAQLKDAVDTYVTDRGNQGRAIAVSYAVAGGLYAAAGIFLVGAFIVGLFALFRWVEIEYGTFPAFGACAGVLVLLALICAGLAASKLNSKTEVVGLSTRLGDALTETPREAKQPFQPQTASFSRAAEKTSNAVRDVRKSATRNAPQQDARPTPATMKAGLLVGAALAGWALARRYNVIR